MERIRHIKQFVKGNGKLFLISKRTENRNKRWTKKIQGLPRRVQRWTGVYTFIEQKVNNKLSIPDFQKTTERKSV